MLSFNRRHRGPPDAPVPYGTLDLMVLKTLDAMGPLHGFGIARRIEQAGRRGPGPQSGHHLSRAPSARAESAGSRAPGARAKTTAAPLLLHHRRRAGASLRPKPRSGRARSPSSAVSSGVSHDGCAHLDFATARCCLPPPPRRSARLKRSNPTFIFSKPSSSHKGATPEEARLAARRAFGRRRIDQERVSRSAGSAGTGRHPVRTRVSRCACCGVIHRSRSRPWPSLASASASTACSSRS